MDLAAFSGTLVPIHLTTWCHRLYKCVILTEKLYLFEHKFYFSITNIQNHTADMFRLFHIKLSSGLAHKNKRRNSFVTHTVYKSLIWSMIHVNIFTAQCALPHYPKHNMTLSLRWWITENFYLHRPNQISAHHYCNYLHLSTFNLLVHWLVIIALYWFWYKGWIQSSGNTTVTWRMCVGWHYCRLYLIAEVQLK
jgi:hypothetical protein